MREVQMPSDVEGQTPGSSASHGDLSRDLTEHPVW